MANLSQTVMEEITEAIKIFDKVGDNKVDVNDIVRLLRALDMNPGSDDWHELVAEYKDRKVERIDLNEFAGIYEEERERKTPSYKELVAGLKSLDPTSGEAGLVNRAALFRYLTLAGDKISDKDAEYLIASAVEKDGKHVNIDVIVRLVMNPVEH